MVDADIVQRTQQTLGSIVKKPPLTEKLLVKPPFRFLHDIMTAVIRNTGFADGLYTDTELVSDNVNDRDAKIAFLQKAVDIVQMVNGQALSIRPAKTVAGQEPDKTNEFLQALAAAVQKRPNCADEVKRVLNGEKLDLSASGGSASSNKENRHGSGKENEKKAEKPNSGSKERSRGDAKDADKKEKRPGTAERKHRETESKEKANDKAKTDTHRSSSKHKKEEKEDVKDKDRDKKHKEKTKDKDDDKAADARVDSAKKEHKSSKERPASSREKEKSKDKEHHKSKHRSHDDDNHIANGVPNGDVKLSRQNSVHDEYSSSQHRTSELSASDKRMAKSAKERLPQDDHADDLTPVHRDVKSAHPTARPGTAIARPPTASGARPGTALGPRPGTAARRAAPRIKRTDVLPEEQPTRLESAKLAAVITTDTKDDEDNFIVEDGFRDKDLLLGQDDEVGEDADQLNAEEHGGLVRKILETKKELDITDNKASEKTTIVFDAKEREKSKKEANKLQEAIQQLTRTSHPLGKLTDFLQEDIDSMLKELDQWRAEYRENWTKIRQEKGTSSSLDGLQSKLQELDQQIRDQQEAINTVKSNLLRNSERTQQIMTHVVKK